MYNLEQQLQSEITNINTNLVRLKKLQKRRLLQIQQTVKKEAKTKKIEDKLISTIFKTVYLHDDIYLLFTDLIETLIKILKDKRYELKIYNHPEKQARYSISKAKEVLITELYQGELRHFTNKWIGLCPFHKENTPSFYIYENTNTFYCFGCGISGDSLDFIQKNKNINFLEALKILS